MAMHKVQVKLVQQLKARWDARPTTTPEATIRFAQTIVVTLQQATELEETAERSTIRLLVFDVLGVLDATALSHVDLDHLSALADTVDRAEKIAWWTRDD